MLFERGDRVISIGVPSTYHGIPWDGQQGTVTHLPGDPPDQSSADGYDPAPGWVWVKWDNSALKEGWQDTDKLRKI